MLSYDSYPPGFESMQLAMPPWLRRVIILTMLNASILFSSECSQNVSPPMFSSSHHYLAIAELPAYAHLLVCEVLSNNRKVCSLSEPSS
jgi:hypothetical protein